MDLFIYEKSDIDNWNVIRVDGRFELGKDIIKQEMVKVGEIQYRIDSGMYAEPIFIGNDEILHLSEIEDIAAKMRKILIER